MTDRLHELVALDAAGALMPDDQRELHALLAEATPADLASANALYDLTALLPSGATPEAPTAAVRARILDHASRYP